MICEYRPANKEYFLQFLVHFYFEHNYVPDFKEVEGRWIVNWEEEETGPGTPSRIMKHLM